MNIQVVKVTLHHTTDDNADYSWIGAYTDNLEPGVIVRDLNEFYEKLPAPMERDVDGRFIGKGEPDNLPSRGRQYRGFRPYAGGESVGTKLYYKYGKQDWERMRGMERQDWCFIGITAKATVGYPAFGSSESLRIETLSSSGIWGVESDVLDYINELHDEELENLRRHLEVFGVDLSGFDTLAAEAKENIRHD